MTFSQYTWDLYRQSKKGSGVISYFERGNVFWNDIKIIKEFNPNQGKWISERGYNELMEAVGQCYSTNNNEPVYRKFNNLKEVRDFYEYILDNGIFYTFDNEANYIIEPKDYQLFLQLNVMLSFYFYEIANEFCFPNLFTYRFFDLNKIVDAFDIKLPKIPKKSDYKARCLFYMDLCGLMYDFRKENQLTPEELCAFLYDFAPNFIKNHKSKIPQPSNAWFIGGKISTEEIKLDNLFWQASPETKRGDILIHYETSPISAITHFWIAQIDGVIDPFFHYYTNTYISEKIKIPKISLKELKENDYFQNHPLVKKNFQGVNGWSLSGEDYKELLNIIESKGFDIKKLPIPYTPETPKGVIINNERDVEIKLLEYYLSELGFVEGRDYVRQLPIRAGRGSKIYPDYVLHYNNTLGYEKAKVLLEVKYYMRNNKEVEEAFIQARSYANILESSIIILCDKKGLIIYEKNKSFDRNNYKKLYWEDLKKVEHFNKLKNILLSCVYE